MKATLTSGDKARVRYLAGETRRLMGSVSRMVSAAARFRKATGKAGRGGREAGADAFRDGAVSALLASMVMLLMPTVRERDADRLMRRLEDVPERLDADFGDDEMEHLAELLLDVIRSGSGREHPPSADAAEGGGR